MALLHDKGELYETTRAVYMHSQFCSVTDGRRIATTYGK